MKIEVLDLHNWKYLVLQDLHMKIMIISEFIIHLILKWLCQCTNQAKLDKLVTCSTTIPISRSCQGWAATDLLDKDERILSFKRGVGRVSWTSSLFSSLIFKHMTQKKQQKLRSNVSDDSIRVKLVLDHKKCFRKT